MVISTLVSEPSAEKIWKKSKSWRGVPITVDLGTLIATSTILVLQSSVDKEQWKFEIVSAIYWLPIKSIVEKNCWKKMGDEGNK